MPIVPLVHSFDSSSGVKIDACFTSAPTPSCLNFFAVESHAPLKARNFGSVLSKKFGQCSDLEREYLSNPANSRYSVLDDRLLAYIPQQTEKANSSFFQQKDSLIDHKDILLLHLSDIAIHWTHEQTTLCSSLCLVFTYFILFQRRGEATFTFCDNRTLTWRSFSLSLSIMWKSISPWQ